MTEHLPECSMLEPFSWAQEVFLQEFYAAALRDAVKAVEDRIQDLATCNKDDECHTLARGAALALSDIQALGGER